ncbi:hypothetical protein AAFC00_004829 [Neodothiora populina]|uniref:Alpha/beta hydrolase fold-3 domain-containing protein n=1 Tax=Neodothiora populina TaxID=2781224 RepID=A0ABR3P3R4_9PEZI
MAPAPPATLFDKLDLFSVLLKTTVVALTRLLSAPVRSGSRPTGLFKDVVYAALRYQMSNVTLTQEKWMNPDTQANYLDLAKQRNFQPDTLLLSSGCKAHWLGDKTAEKTIVYFHGGGYVLPCSPGHFRWLLDLSKDLAMSTSISSVVLHYTCAPEGQYPTQLRQAVELLDHLINKEGRRPSNIIIAGDSAGANLAMCVLSHVLHPHPDISTKLELSEPFRAALLISPYVDFDVDQTSFNRNQGLDFVTKEVGVRWSSAFVGNAPKDAYFQPLLADDAWFSKLDTAISDLLIWGGSGEVLIDSIRRLADKLKRGFPKAELIIEPGAAHEEFIIERLLGYNHKAQGAQVIESWLSARL